MSLDHTVCAFGSNDRHIRVFNMKNGEELFTQKFDYPVSGVALSALGTRLAVSHGPMVFWLDLELDGKNLFTFHQEKTIHAIAINTGANSLAVAGESGVVSIYSLRSGKEKYTFDAGEPVYAVSLAQARKYTTSLQQKHFEKSFLM